MSFLFIISFYIFIWRHTRKIPPGPLRSFRNHINGYMHVSFLTGLYKRYVVSLVVYYVCTCVRGFFSFGILLLQILLWCLCGDNAKEDFSPVVRLYLRQSLFRAVWYTSLLYHGWYVFGVANVWCIGSQMFVVSKLLDKLRTTVFASVFL